MSKMGTSMWNDIREPGNRRSSQIPVLTFKGALRIGPERKRDVEKLVDKTSYNLFGDFEVEEKLYTSYLSIGIETEEGEMAGVICLQNFPNIPAVPKWEWTSWMRNLYGVDKVYPRNTFFIHLLLWDNHYRYFFLQPLLQYLFFHYVRLEYVILIIPPGGPRMDFLDSITSRVVPKNEKSKLCQSFYLLTRQHFAKRYKIRRAVEEDNDDLVPLLDIQSTRLKEMYGDYYITELLTRHKDCGRQIIVAEYEGCAVGVACVNESINYEVLNEEFELMPFNGLRKAHKDDDIRAPSSVEARPSIDGVGELASSMLITSLGNMESTSLENLSMALEDRKQHSYEECIIHVSEDSSDSSDFSIVLTSSSLFLFQDEDNEDESSLSSNDYVASSAMMLSYAEYESHLYKESTYDKQKVPLQEKFYKEKPAKKIPKFYGAPNAFVVELLSVYSQYKDSLHYVFEACFELFAEREYMIIALPSTHPLTTSYFFRVAPRPESSFPQELYLLHKNSMNGRLEVRLASRDTEKKVIEMLATVNDSNCIIKMFMYCINFENSPYDAFVMTCEGQVIGVAILSEEHNVDYLKTHYNLKAWTNTRIHPTGCHGTIEHLVVYPIFHKHAKFFMQELHRISDYSILYYRIQQKELHRERSIASLLDFFVPVIPRMQTSYNLSSLEGMEPQKVVLRQDEPYGLYISTPRLSTLARQEINNKIVVVGASDVAISFLESMLFTHTSNYKVTFNNVTLVSPHGIVSHKVVNKAREMMFIKNGFLDERLMDMMCLKAYVNTCNGIMTGINRKDQYISINDDTFLSYDLLFLMCGEQFQRTFVTPSNYLVKKRTQFEFPDNVFIINTHVDASNALFKLKLVISKQTKTDYTIIVYGHFLQAYCCLAALLAFGVPGKRITFVEPFPRNTELEGRHIHNKSFFSDPDVDECVLDNIKAEGITHYQSYYFIEWNFDQTSNLVTSCVFESKYRFMNIPCAALFLYHGKSISPRTFQAINDAGLVFDGRLVIDHECRTNDPHIYGAGTTTKYSRKYYANHMIHKNFNREEVGYCLGQQIKKMLLGVNYERHMQSWNFHYERGDMLVPMYEKPVMKYCRLPGNLYFLSIAKPGRKIPLEVAISRDDYGQVFITGECKNLDRQGYFRLHLNEYKQVETITCLTKFPIDVYNLSCLWGKHEKLLNNLVVRFEMVLITDFFEYFSEPWVYAIYSDRFPAFINDLHDLITSLKRPDGSSIIEELVTIYKENKWKKLDKDKTDEIDDLFTSAPYQKILELKLLDFLTENEIHLPMYAHPDLVRIMLQGYFISPLFRTQ